MGKGTRGVAAIVAGAATLAMVGPAEAGQVTTKPTDIFYDDSANVAEGFVVSGHIESGSRRCYAGREVILRFEGGAADRATTSTNGAFAGRVPVGSGALRIKVLPKKLTKKLRCGGAQTSIL